MVSSKLIGIAWVLGASVLAQSLTEQDLAYGLNLHQQIIASAAPITTGEPVTQLSRIFARLTNTSIAQQSPTRLILFYLAGSEINAMATAGGRLYVYDGLVQAVHSDQRILAFAIAHEMAHNIRQHGIQKALRLLQEQQYLDWYNRRIALGDNKAQWELLAWGTAQKIADQKFARDTESEADRLGLMICAEAGYHPDFAILSARTLRSILGDQSKFGAFFADHPRWTTREERMRAILPDAIKSFSEHWANPIESPGGMPPPVFDFGPPVIDRAASKLILPVAARNINGPVGMQLEAAGLTSVWEFLTDSKTSLELPLSPAALKQAQKSKNYAHVIAKSGDVVLDDENLEIRRK